MAPSCLESISGRSNVPLLGCEIGFYTVILVQLCAGSGGVSLANLPPGPLHSTGTEPTDTDRDSKLGLPPSSKT